MLDRPAAPAPGRGSTGAAAPRRGRENGQACQKSCLYRRAKVRTLFYGLFTRVYGLKHRKTRGGLMHAGIFMQRGVCDTTNY